MINPNILFCVEAWCDGVPEMGLSNNHHNIIGSFKHSMLGIPFNIVHFDQTMKERKIHIDDILPKICNKLGTNIVVFSLINKFEGSPTQKVFTQLKKMGIKSVIMWADVGIDWGFPQVLEYNESLVDLHVGWDNADSDFHRTRINPLNFQQMWVPQDPKRYFKQEKQDIPISFVGSTHIPERQQYLNHAINVNKLPIMVRGGQRQEKLSAEMYASLVRNSKISINFPYCLGSFSQCKGRVYEVLASCSMLLERKNEATSKLFTPGYDYVEYDTPDDFVDKIKFFLKNDKERETIAEQGYKTYNEKYTAKIFWSTIFDKLNLDEKML